MKGVALVAILALVASVGVEDGDGPLYKRVSVKDGFSFTAQTGGQDWSVKALEQMVTQATGLPPLTEIIPAALRSVGG